MDTTPTASHDRSVAALTAATAELTTATVQAMEARHDWFATLAPEPRSWITVVARTGIDGFVSWFAGESTSPVNVFETAPRALLRKVSLAQTVELVRTTIDVCEEQLSSILPAADQPLVERALLEYSREVAFAAAGVYARAAELRGAWDARLEALVVDAVVRGEVDESTLSRASTVGWHTSEQVCVVVGPARDDSALDDVRLMASKAGLDVLAGPMGDRTVLVLGGPALTDDAAAVAAVADLAPLFGGRPVVVGPVVDHLIDAVVSARAAVSGLHAVVAWPNAPDVVTAGDLLPERALAGDGHARRALAAISAHLAAAGGDLLVTTQAFLDHHGSVEATARALFVHANTVRYRLRRVHETTGYSPHDARDAYVLRIALTLGRLLD